MNRVQGLLVAISFLRSHADGFLIPEPSFLGRVSRQNGHWSTSLELQPEMESINSHNDELFKNLDCLRQKEDFRFYSVDILASCEYIPQELFECYTESCEVYPADEDEVPPRIVNADKEESEFELDGWGRWDMPTIDYYDTEVFSEGYTGYDGSEVWKYIHNRICFSEYGYDGDSWKSDFNKAVSGLHSMISLQIVQGIQEKIDSGEAFTDDEIWRDPKAEFNRRLSAGGETPAAIENLYFTYMLLLAALGEVKGRIGGDLSSGKIGKDAEQDLKAVLDSSVLSDAPVNYVSEQLRAHTTKDNEAVQSLWEARMRTRELLRIMNCVQCNKCRLHGKISAMGLSTAFKVLIGKTGTGGDPASIQRVELAALVATLHKFSRAIKFFRWIQDS